MAKKWDWTTIGLIVLAQIGLAVCYWGVFTARSGDDLAATAEKQLQAADKSVRTKVNLENTPKKKRINNQEVVQAHFERSAPAKLPVFPPVSKNVVSPIKTAPLRIAGKGKTNNETNLQKLKNAAKPPKKPSLPGYPAPPPPEVPITPNNKKARSNSPDAPSTSANVVLLPTVPDNLLQQPTGNKTTPIAPVLTKPPIPGNDVKIPPLRLCPKPGQNSAIPLPPPLKNSPPIAKQSPVDPDPKSAKAAKYDLNTHICTPATLTFAAISERYYKSKKYAFALRNFNSELAGINQMHRPLQVLDRVVIPHVNLLETRYASDIVDQSNPLPPVVNEAPGPSPWKLSVQFAKGRTRLTARTDQGVELVIRCDRLNVKRPNGAIEAIGKVAIEGKDLNGSCERLTIHWDEERMHLNGNAHVRSRQSGEEIEMNAEDLRLRLRHK